MQGTQNKNSHQSNELFKNLKVIEGEIGVFLCKYVAIPVTVLILTGGIIGAIIYAVDIQAQAKMDAAELQSQADATKRKEESFSSSLLVKDLLSSLLAREKLSNTQIKLIEVKLFTTFRNLDSKGKGHLIRLLDEGGFIKANKPEISLSGANLQQIDLHDAWLPDINLKGAYISGGKLSQTNLKRANLIEAKLNSTNLTGANLTEAKLTGADLNRANLTDANLTGADLNNADLNSAKLCNTTMPNGSKSRTGC
jgi:uncharacterized protein YjbI with pentapeptide repeats